MSAGAKFYKCDFQVHSPRDINFTGKQCITREERQEYAKRFIKACREKGIGAVAITDHHDLAFYPYIKWAAEFEGLDPEKDSPLSIEERLIVFPGMELTLDVPCQAIVVFDAFLEIDEILAGRLYTALGITEFNKPELSKTAQTKSINANHINDIFERLDKIPELKNKYLVIPNVKKDGKFTILRQKAHNQYAAGKFIVGYLDGNIYEKCSQEPGWNNIINGKTDAYGNRSIAIFQTSDNRDENFGLLGTAQTWVKFYEPTAEGLRQACLAKQSRISQTKPNLPNTFISNVEVKSSTFLLSFNMRLNSQLNVLIGGRGTGKSSVLQYIMYALGIKNEPIKEFIEGTLKAGEVILTVEKSSVHYRVKRNAQGHFLSVGGNEWDTTSADIISDIIQVDAYVQKELSEHKNDRVALVNHLVSFSIKDKLKELSKKLEANEGQIKKYFTDCQRFIQLQKLIKELDNRRNSLTLQIEELNKTIIGQDNEQLIVERQTIIEKEKFLITEIFNNYTKSLNDLLANLDEVSLNTPLDSNELVNKKEIGEFFFIIQSFLETITDKAKIVVNDNSKIDEVKEFLKNIEDKHSIQTAEYEVAKSRLSENNEALTTIEKNREAITLISYEFSTTEKELETLKGVKFRLLRCFIERFKLSQDEFQLKKVEAERLSTHSEGGMEILLTNRNDFNKIIEAFENKISKVRGTSESIESYFNKILLVDSIEANRNVLKFWYSIFCFKLELVNNLDEQLNKFKIPNDGIIQDANIDRITNIEESSLIDLALILPSYKPTMEYYVSSINKIPFHNASYGQQAGAILNILLNQTHGPLIIDQPEDDLDNKIIHQIAERICATKENRQLIFSSHNANIAVNGDAELIIHFDHNEQSKGEVKLKGAIDADNIKNSILNIMEGGEKAFELRKKKYNLY